MTFKILNVFSLLFSRLRSSDSDPAVILKHQEQLEIEKKRYEDFEFQLMEGEAHTEAEKEDILNEIRYLENEIQGKLKSILSKLISGN